MNTTQKTITGNKGEWSEAYVALKLLVDGEIAESDESLNKIASAVFPVAKVIREEGKNRTEYNIIDRNNIKIECCDNVEIIDISDLKNEIQNIFEAIVRGGDKAFPIPFADKTLQKVKITKLNAGNSKKEDITINVQDYTTGSFHDIGFSIKSKIGSPATLLNPSVATNFTYKVEGVDDAVFDDILSRKLGPKKTVEAIYNNAGKLVFEAIDSVVFADNLRLIDSSMPEIVAEVVKTYFSENGSKMLDLVKNVVSSGFRHSGVEYSELMITHKIKSLLNDIALGMVPAKRWDGRLRAYGGMIVVKDDGDLVCFYVYNVDKFKDYLFNNVKLDTPSTGRYRYGNIYKKDGEMFIKLNLQIRFIK